MVIGEIAFGVASSLVWEAIRKPYNLLSAELKRKERVNRALTDTTVTAGSHSQRSTEAMADLSRIIANSHGALNDDVSTFIRELRRTAIPEAIANSVLCGASPQALLPSFTQFFSKFEGMPFSSLQFFNSLVVACEERINNVNDRPLLEIIRAQHSQLVSQVDQIARSLAQQNAAGSITLEELQDCRLKLSKAIEAANRYTAVETLQGTKRVKLKSLAIPSRLTPLSDGEIAAAKISTDEDALAYLTFRRMFERAVILGDPGGGKSTLTQMLCNDLSTLINLEASNPGRKDFDASDLKLPLRIILRSFEAKNTHDPAYNFLDYLVDEATLPLDNDAGLARKVLQHVLSTGEAILIFDGLDEVLELGKRRQIVSLIEQFCEIYAACSVLVTSRLVGYRDAPLTEDFAPYGLARFSSDEIQKYAAKSIRAVSLSQKREADIKAAEFLRQTARVGGDLRQNPLMLGLMVQIFVYRGDVPSNRPEVYKECATLMFEKWDGRRDIVVQNVPKDDMELLDVFGYVAHRTFGDASNEEGVTRDWLTKELRKHFEGWYIDKASANRSAKSLVDFLTGRAWVMSEVGSGVFKFTHRTFLEYFFARHLISKSEGVTDLLKVELLPHILKNEWVVISHLALHMAIFRDGGKARQAAEVIRSLLVDEQVFPAPQELALLEFIASTLEYLIIPEGLYLDIVTRLFKRAVYLGSHEELAALSVIWSAFSTAAHRTHLAVRAINEVFTHHLEGRLTAEMLFCIYVLGSKQRDSFVESPIPHRLRRHRRHGVLWSSLESIRMKHKAAIFERAHSNLPVAKAYIFAFGDMRAELYAVHGPQLLEPSLSALVPIGVDQLFSGALEIASHNLVSGSQINLEEAADCQNLIKAVSESFMRGEVTGIAIPAGASQRANAIESDIENTVAQLWQTSMRRVSSAKSRQSMAEILLGVSLVIDGFAEDIKSRVVNAKSRKNYFFAPRHVFDRLIERTGETALEQPLKRWLSETPAIRKVDGDR